MRRLLTKPIVHLAPNVPYIYTVSSMPNDVDATFEFKRVTSIVRWRCEYCKYRCSPHEDIVTLGVSLCYYLPMVEALPDYSIGCIWSDRLRLSK